MFRRTNAASAKPMDQARIVPVSKIICGTDDFPDHGHNAE